MLVTLTLSWSAPRSAHAKKYTLDEILAIARRNSPSVAAAEQATMGVQAQLAEAQRSRYPTGEFLSFVAPVPTVRCIADTAPDPSSGLTRDSKSWREAHCDQTNTREAARLQFGGVLTRTEVRLVQPLYTFGKISAGIEAATAGVEASRSRERATADEVALMVKRAYYSMQLARQLEATIKEGAGFLAEAQKRIDKEIEEGEGASVTDRLRLRTLRAETDVRMLEAERGEDLARQGLKLLIGADAPEDVDLVDDELKPVDVPKRPLAHYEEQARLSRPEVRALNYLVDATEGLADLEWRKQLPDLVLIGAGTFARATSIDDPRFAFANDPYNTLTGGVVLAVRISLDFGVKHARAMRVRADASATQARRREALGGIAFEVAKAYGELRESSARMEVAGRGEKAARAWITAVAQNMELGLAEAKDFGDALLQYFNMRVRRLQAIYDFNMASATLGRATGSDVTVAAESSAVTAD